MPPPIGVDTAQMPPPPLFPRPTAASAGENGAGNGGEPQRVSYREEDSMNVEHSMSGKKIVGLIIPPPDIRAIVDKTALFVARNGIEFENKIKEREATNTRFNFLAPLDPYHAYYRAKIGEFETGVTPEGLPQPSASGDAAKAQLPQAVRDHIKKAEFVPKAPPKPMEFSADPTTLNAFDLDLIRLSAMFVARNGRQFLTQLMNREARNYQFDFLKPQHSNFPYFTQLVEQYTKVLIPSRGVVDELRKSRINAAVMADVEYRVGWEKWTKAQRDRENAEVERERLAYNQIDWHDFVIVQTVDFQSSETVSLPPLCTPKDVGTRILLQQRSEAARAASDSVAMEMDSDSEGEEEEEGEGQQAAAQDESTKLASATAADKQHAAYEVTQPVPDAPSADSVVIRDYDPKRGRSVVGGLAAAASVEKYIISPLTNERIPADKLREHVRYSTVDPQYKEQRDREQMERQDEDPTNASGTEISRSLGKLAERRTDIFGVGVHGAEQTVIGKRLGEEERIGAAAALRGAGEPKPKAPVIWDGQQSSIDATTRAAQQAGGADQQLSQQISDIRQVHAFIVQDLQPSQQPAAAPAATSAQPAAAGSTFAAPLPPAAAPPVLAPPQPPMAQPRPPFPMPGMGGMMPLPGGMPGMPPHLPPGLRAPMPPMPGMPPMPPGYPGAGGFYPPPHPHAGFTPMQGNIDVQAMLAGGGGRGPAPPPMPMHGLPPPPPGPPAPPPQQSSMEEDDAGQGDEPAMKRPRGEETLEPEGVWLNRVGNGPISFQILPPQMEGVSAGPPVQLQMEITTLVGDLKALIQEKTGVPASKVKLSYDGMFLKDNFSLAYYNLINGAALQSHVKERGGRKK